MGIRDKPGAPASPWQNGFAERLIGSIRRECVDHFIIFGEAHLRLAKRCLSRQRQAAAAVPGRIADKC
jgi:transposase InsO family protein